MKNLPVTKICDQFKSLISQGVSKPKILLELMQTYNIKINDVDIDKIQDENSLTKILLDQGQKSIIFKGDPAKEIFENQILPFNLYTIKYRKPKKIETRKKYHRK